jgi:NADPH2:quinone reductase
MTTMRAIQQTEFGGPEVLEVAELPRPEPAEGQVLIEVTRAGINYADTHNRENTYLAAAQLPLVPGGEIAGRRTDTGARVVALCGTGGYAQYAVAPEALTFPIPDGIDDGAALAMIVQGLTAWHLYRTSARLQPGESVVVQAAAGGVGTLAVQLGRPLGAGRVIAVASSPEKRELALELGADAAIDAEPEGMKERIVAANDGRKVDVVLEMSGGRVLEEALRALAPRGRLAVYGAASGQANEVPTGRLMRASLSVVGFWLVNYLGDRAANEAALVDLFGRVLHGRLRVVIGGTYALADARRAHEDLRARRTTGKLLLDPSA